jgi:hypothetical protein
MAQESFIDRVLQRLPKAPVTEYFFTHWRYADRPTDEAFGLLPIRGADPEKVLARVMDVNAYVGNIAQVVECRAIPDPVHTGPQSVRFYQRIRIPVLGDVHHELVLERLGQRQGYEVAAWHQLARETEALGSKSAIRSQHNDGAWLVAPGVVGYALSSAPRRDDVGFLKWKALTTGADVLAAKVIRDNIEGVAAWAAR